MQGAAGKSALRQTGIDRGEPERQRFMEIRYSRQQAAQLLHEDSAIMRYGKSGMLGHGYARMFTLCSQAKIRTKEKHCKPL